VQEFFGQEFLGLVPFSNALNRQQEYLQSVSRLGSVRILGFETHPVVTLGRRASCQDRAIQLDGFEVCMVDRGGQATLHNPGQLVIFPVCDIRSMGVRKWVNLLVRTTQVWARELGVDLEWRENCPGLYSSAGKVVSLGLRVECGISSHGLSINVHNDLAPFSLFRVCGVSGARMARIPTEIGLEALFAAWVREFQLNLTSSGKSPILRPNCAELRL